MAVFCATGTGANLTATGFAGPDAALMESIVNNLAIMFMSDLITEIEYHPVQSLLEVIPDHERHVRQHLIGRDTTKAAFEVRFIHNPTVAYSRLVGQTATYSRVMAQGMTVSGEAFVAATGGPGFDEGRRVQLASMFIQFISSVTYA